MICMLLACLTRKAYSVAAVAPAPLFLCNTESHSSCRILRGTLSHTCFPTCKSTYLESSCKCLFELYSRKCKGWSGAASFRACPEISCSILCCMIRERVCAQVDASPKISLHSTSVIGIVLHSPAKTPKSLQRQRQCRELVFSNSSWLDCSIVTCATALQRPNDAPTQSQAATSLPMATEFTAGHQANARDVTLTPLVCTVLHHAAPWPSRRASTRNVPLTCPRSILFILICIIHVGNEHPAALRHQLFSATHQSTAPPDNEVLRSTKSCNIRQRFDREQDLQFSAMYRYSQGSAPFVLNSRKYSACLTYADAAGPSQADRGLESTRVI